MIIGFHRLPCEHMKPSIRNYLCSNVQLSSYFNIQLSRLYQLRGKTAITVRFLYARIFSKLMQKISEYYQFKQSEAKHPKC